MPISGAFRSRALAVCLATGVFIVLAVPISAVIDVPIDQAVLIAGMGGFAIGALRNFTFRRGPGDGSVPCIR